MFIEKVKENLVNLDLRVSKFNSIFKGKTYTLETFKKKSIFLRLKPIILLLRLLKRNQN